MKKCEKYNMKTEFEKLRDFDFMVFYELSFAYWLYSFSN